ncbi:Xaa-Pro peptidase family protein [uncultured Corynebacterium sp.]|uniref:M24 family metallopeptidase n=1 Tax=uncultured Corynebacterium sp. TaxID=159447 RepID=UPI0025EDC328|nr:Xaa-Pro peptidase family protein [uncultured Corynebacterium sp.]
MSEAITPFAPAVYADRVRRAQEAARDHGIDAIIVAPGPDFAYLTGSWMSSHERLTALLIPADGRGRVVAPATDGFQLEASAVPEIDVDIVGWQDGQSAHELLVDGFVLDTVAVGASMTADHLLRLQELTGARFVPAATALAELFTRKDDAEIEQLRRAGRAIDAVHDQVPALLSAGRTERDVAADLEQLILAEHYAVDFVIVGSGPNGANPHHSFSDRVLEHGDVVVVDIGGTLGAGYHSDCTRTYIVGGPEAAAPEVAEAYAVLQRAQSAARLLAAPGVEAQAVDAAARGIIDEAGFGRSFSHRTGHGIGLSTHEEPFIIDGNALELQPGMAFSIEPGIYLDGQWGMRLEDIVVVTADGIETLNNGERGLQ